MAENTSWLEVASVPCQYHSPTILPLRLTSRQLDPDCSAWDAMASSLAWSKPISAASAWSHSTPG